LYLLLKLSVLLYCLMLTIFVIQQAKANLCTTTHKSSVELEAHAGKKNIRIPPKNCLRTFLACSCVIYIVLANACAIRRSVHAYTHKMILSVQLMLHKLLLLYVTAIHTIHMYMSKQIADPDLLLGPTHRKYNLCHYCKDKPAGLFLTCQEVYTHIALLLIHYNSCCESHTIRIYCYSSFELGMLRVLLHCV
jgi:hypothetical protein